MAILSKAQLEIAARCKHALEGSKYDGLIKKSTRFKRDHKTNGWYSKFPNGITIYVVECHQMVRGRIYVSDPEEKGIPFFFI